MMGWEVKIIQRVELGFNYDILIFRHQPNGDVTVLLPGGQAEVIKEFAAVTQASLTIPGEALAPLLQALSDMGVKPTDGGRIEGELKAQSSHLRDLRRLLKLPEERTE